MLLPPFLLVLAFTSGLVHSVYTTISSADELIEFSKAVGDGTTYLGTTVTLANDIDLSGVDFTPIGRYENGANALFRGVFDGNGYLIKNMNVTISTSKYAGLFGYTVGCTIKDVIIDSSCSVTNKKNDVYTYSGGIIGYADAGIGVGETAILNCVNMGTITGSGPYPRVGGIAGILYAFKSPVKIVNCVNLGNIAHSGTTVTEVYVGGIAGWMTLENEYNVSSVYNCVNMGTITTSSTVAYIGAIVGMSSSDINSLSIIQNNYWMSGTGLQGYNGNANASNNEEFSSSYALSSGGSLVDALNNYVDSQSSYDLRKWGAVTFDTDGGSAVSSMISMWVLLGTPDAPTKDGLIFYGWYTDSALQTIWDASAQFNGDSTLYAKWVMNQYSVVFDFGNGTRTEEIVLEYDEAIIYPADPMIEGYTFIGWDKNITNMPAENITITAVWKANNYTVVFDFGNGTAIEEIISFNGTITYPKDLVMEGHTFNGWDKNITNMPAHNITITAVWKEIPTEYVEVVFNKKDMTKDEVHEFVSKYVPNDNYVIKTFEPGNDGTTVIIKFNDANEAKNFRETIEFSRKNDSAINNLIKRIAYADGKDDGFSLQVSVFSLRCLLSLLS